MKVCKKCGEEKEESEFRLRKRASGNSHYENVCKKCNYNPIKAKIYRFNNKDHIAKLKKKWAKNNYKHVQNQSKSYYLKNKEIYKKKCKEYQQSHKYKIAAKKYRDAHKERIAIYNKIYRLNNKEHTRKNHIKYYIKNIDIIKDRSKKHNREQLEKLTDSYIKKLLIDKGRWPKQLITQKIIDLKRKQILLYRKLNSK